jgi:hypothetical protein
LIYAVFYSGYLFGLAIAAETLFLGWGWGGKKGCSEKRGRFCQILPNNYF